MEEVEDQDGGSPPRAAPICHSGPDASRADSPLDQVGDPVEETPTLCVETLVGVPLAVGVDFLETVCGLVAPWC